MPVIWRQHTAIVGASPKSLSGARSMDTSLDSCFVSYRSAMFCYSISSFR